MHLRFTNKEIDLSKDLFTETDGCPTNKGDQKGFKLYFSWKNPYHIHETCNSHTLALIPLHKIKQSEFKCVADADKLMYALWTLFHDSGVKMSIFENTQIVLTFTPSSNLVCCFGFLYHMSQAFFNRSLDLSRLS